MSWVETVFGKSDPNHGVGCSSDPKKGVGGDSGHAGDGDSTHGGQFRPYWPFLAVLSCLNQNLALHF